MECERVLRVVPGTGRATAQVMCAAVCVCVRHGCLSLQAVQTTGRVSSWLSWRSLSLFALSCVSAHPVDLTLHERHTLPHTLVTSNFWLFRPFDSATGVSADELLERVCDAVRREWPASGPSRLALVNHMVKSVQVVMDASQSSCSSSDEGLAQLGDSCGGNGTGNRSSAQQAAEQVLAVK